jgi:MoaA/NifB/PqqE/SkfB family radical SAM enzyme
MLELTSRCNLRCVHCYLGPQAEQHRHRALEMDTARVCSVIDELAAAGCLYLTITGGDPMMRKDFAEVYRHAREAGLLVTVFCDAILVTDRILELFTELPPRKVEVSIYGATAETYERITRVPGSFPRAMAGIQRLLDHRINLSLKTVLMTLNQDELPQMEAMARERGVDFRFDGAIFPCLSAGGREPLELRVDAREVVEAEMSDPDRKARWVNTYRREQAAPESDSLYTCGAGKSTVYISPFGQASPCLMTTRYRFDLSEKGFQKCWDHDIAPIRERKSSRRHGALRGACSNCPGVNLLETGREDVESEYTSELRRLRHEAIVAASSETGEGYGAEHG